MRPSGVIVGTVAVLLTGCTRPSFGPSTKPGTTVLLRNEVKTLDPALIQDFTTATVLLHIYSPLSTDRNGCLSEIRPNKTNTEFTLTLKPINFSDGSPVTADDVAFTLARVRNPKLGAAIGESLLQGVKAIKPDKDDPRKIILSLSAADAGFKDRLAFPGLSVVSARHASADQPITDPKQGIGAGKFTWGDRVVLGETIRLKNDQESNLEFRVVKDATTRRNMAEQSKCIALFGAHERDAYSALPNSFTKTQAALAGLVYVQLQSKALPLLANQKVRIALFSVLNPQKITSLVGSTAFLVDDYKFDKQKAKRLLAEAGFKDGKGIPSFELNYAEAGRSNTVVDYIVTQWRNELGLNVTARGNDAAALAAANARGEIAFYFTGWTPDFAGPWNTMPFLFESKSPENRSGFNDPTVDNLFAKARQTGNLNLLKQAEERIWKTLPVLPLYQPSETIVYPKQTKSPREVFPSFGAD